MFPYPCPGRVHHLCRVALAQAPKDDPRFSPLLFPSHAGVAPAFIGYNGMDALRDDSRIWIKVLGEAGVKVKANLYVPLSTAAACEI